MPDSLEVAANKIAIKAADLKLKKFDIGAPVGVLQQAGYGGYYQEFQQGRIYSHHTVGTFEVHGGILKKFLTRNGVDVNPAMQRRELGFPVTDEMLTPEGYPVSKFEWGEIIFFPGTDGGVAISGEICKSWRGGYFPAFGYPLTSNLRMGRFEYCLFERGICIQLTGQPKTHWMRAYFPLIGNASVVNLTAGELPIQFGTTKAGIASLGDQNEVAALIREHYCLQQVSDKQKNIPLFIRSTVETGSGSGDLVMKLGCQLANNIMRQKGATLYDLVVKNENNGYSLMSPHCIFHRPNWNNFGLLHATDIHVARRIDHFGKIFREKQAKYPAHSGTIQEGIAHLNNWNNGFRDFIRYANAMYRQGVVDGIVATGDIVDYLFETGEFEDGGGNFKFLRDLILGYSPYPGNEHTAEELLVPIFITLGNHDYRVKPYHPFQRLHIPLHSDKDIANYKSYNLTKNEARILQGADPAKLDDEDQGRPKEDSESAKIQVVPATELSFWPKDHLAYYKRYINHTSDFVVPLGKHKVIMIDTGHDLGAPDGNWDRWDAVTTALGLGNTDENAFQLRSSPNCKGPGDAALSSLKAVSNTDGVIIVGMHAPPLNIFGNEYNHFFRETERQQADELQIVSFLFRNSKSSFSVEPGPGQPREQIKDNAQALELARRLFPEWFTGTPAFKKGSPLNFLHEGVSRDNINLFLKLICGYEGAGKPIDLLLTGHDHCMSELRLRTAPNGGELQYFTDFYTENPGEFHRSVLYSDLYSRYGSVGIFTTASNQNTGIPQPIDAYRIMYIPQYANPLNVATDKVAWWNAHKPLLIQGAPLGPTDHNNREKEKWQPVQPSFEGCKLIIIRNDTIDKILQVPRKELAKNTYALPQGVQGISFGVTPDLGGNVGVGRGTVVR